MYKGSYINGKPSGYG
jgi:hypothetical protein